MALAISESEAAQLQQTIEMFEVITQSQPDDYQSLEILKEAYSKLNRDKDAVGTAKRIAEAYVRLGQLSSAIMEYETILQRFPDDPDVRKALADIESRATSFNAPPPEEPKAATKAEPAKKGADGKVVPADVDDGKQMMQKIFVDGKFLTLGDFNLYWATPDSGDPGHAIEPFIQVLADKNILPVDKSLKLLCERSRLAYLPLEKYDLDVELARTFPKSACQRWCVLPVDRMSKSVFVATANPFNKQAVAELQAATQHRLLLYMASPPELVKAIKKVFR